MNGELRTKSGKCISEPFSKCVTCGQDLGYIHVYTGDGKGKTTAAIGLAIRAIGAGKKVFIGQFVKEQAYSEMHALKQFIPQVQLEQFDLPLSINRNMQADDPIKVGSVLQKLKTILTSGNYDVVILDEANIALFYELLPINDFLQILQDRKCSTEVVITGRYAHAQLLEMADLVTDMTEVKHYYRQGVFARDGIER